MLLFPDMSRTTYNGSETFVFAAPCTRNEYYQILRHPQATDDGVRLPFVLLQGGDKDDHVCIILRRDETTDDECVETAAWIRIVHENFNGMIYAMTYVSEPMFGSIASVIARTSGANPKQVKHIDLETKED